MTAPSTQTRTDVYVRDGYRCVMCTAVDGLTFQHRRAVGMGGSKNLPTTVDGLTLCLTCNEACEHSMQTVALANILFTDASQPEELIYKLTKAMYDFHTDLVNAHKATKDTTLETAVKGMTLPLHPGSVEDYASASFTAGGTNVRLTCSWRLHAGQDAVIAADFSKRSRANS